MSPMRGGFCIAVEAASVQDPHGTIAAHAGNRRFPIVVPASRIGGAQPPCHRRPSLTINCGPGVVLFLPVALRSRAKGGANAARCMSAHKSVIAQRSMSEWIDRLTPDRTITILLFVAGAFAACFTPAQNDTWWHLRAGEETWRAGAVQLHDTFSHTAYGTYWPNQEWLGEVVLYLLYAAGGLPLMTVFAALLITTSWALVWSITPGAVTRRAALCSVAIMCCAREWSLRPKIFTLFFVAVTIFLLARRGEYWLPPLFALWPNLHGGVLLGVVILAAAAAAASVVNRRAWHPLTGVALASALATNATPLGFSLWPEIVSSLGRIGQLGIQEWAPAAVDATFAPFWLLSAVLV